ncbi:hypothetical protein V8J88_07575 [Massilia sp. W12]|uniref:hypothetical protein n=1 Tax=Massilia sp. W12 TaxID=3126507 RepID=UPI0030D24F61
MSMNYAMPLELGGVEAALNQMYLPPEAAELKQFLDLHIILPLCQEGLLDSYSADPQYLGDSQIPQAVAIQCGGKWDFKAKLVCWGPEFVPQEGLLEVREAPQVFQIRPPAPQLSVEKFLESFWLDYADWNDWAYALSERIEAENPGQYEHYNEIDAAYAGLLQAYCVADFNSSGASFDSISKHHPRTESIIAQAQSGDARLIYTRSLSIVEGTRLTSFYEYQLQQQAGVWRIVQLNYVNDEGKWGIL